MRPAYLAMAMLAAACGGADDPTEILVIAESDLPPPTEIDAVRFVIDGTAIGDGLFTRRIELASAADLPASLALRHAGGPLGPIVLDVIGERGGEDAVSARASAFFVRGELLTLRIWLLAECVGRDGCGELDGGVMAADAEAIPDADRPDAGGPDAGSICPAACASTCDPVCTDASCTCARDCRCTLACPADADCDSDCQDRSVCEVDGRAGRPTAVQCSGEASCVVDGRDSSDLYVDCDGATCAVDCRGASTCLVRCHNGAECLVECAGAASCRFQSCPGPRSCPGGALVCNRDCP